MVDIISKVGFPTFETLLSLLFFLTILPTMFLLFKFDNAYADELNSDLSRFSSVSDVNNYEVEIRLPTEQIEDLDYVKKKIKEGHTNKNIEFETSNGKTYLIYKSFTVT